MLLSSCGRSGMGEHTRYTLSIPRKAAARLDLSAKSAITVSVPDGAFAASFLDLYIARCALPVRATSLKTVRPTVPLAPVIRIMTLSFIVRSSKSYAFEETQHPRKMVQPWLGHRKGAQFCKLGFCKFGGCREGSLRMSRAGNHQRNRREVEGAGHLASGLRAQALCAVARTAPRN